MKNIALFISFFSLCLPLMVAEAHSGHGMNPNGASFMHYLAEHQGVTLTLIALTLAIFGRNLVFKLN